jgi:N-acetylneuraminate synthase
MKPFTFGDRKYDFLSPYIIAEIGVNHEGDLDRAKRLIEAAARGGAHAAKFQSYKADLLAAKGSSPAYWDRTKEAADSQHTLFTRWDNFGEAEYRALADTCRDCGVDFMSTPFDLTAVDLVAELSPTIKIASADITNVPLLRKVGATGRPLIMSTGAARFDEVAMAVHELLDGGSDNLALLHCVLNYPTAPGDAQLAQIPELAKVFGEQCAIGYSDHVKPDDDGAMPVLEMACLLGSVVIEKHFTDDKTGVGNDHYHAMDEHDLLAFTKRLARFREFNGSSARNLSGQGSAIQNARRRIVAATDLEPGQVIGETDLIALRSNRGIEISHWDRIIGRTVANTVTNGAPLEWKDVQ